MVWDTNLKRVGKSHDNVFFEDQFPSLKQKSKGMKTGLSGLLQLMQHVLVIYHIVKDWLYGEGACRHPYTKKHATFVIPHLMYQS